MRRPKTRTSRPVHPAIRGIVNNDPNQITDPSDSSAAHHAMRQEQHGERFSSMTRRAHEVPGTLPTHRRQNQSHAKRPSNRRSRSRNHKNSQSRSQYLKYPIASRRKLKMTPSRLWGSIPLKFRLITLVTGFLFLYYGLFGKHHYFDREISAIHSEVEKLIGHANRSGFMKRNFVEAELPEIFRENSDLFASLPKKSEKNSKTAAPDKNKKNKSVKKKGKHSDSEREKGKASGSEKNKGNVSGSEKKEKTTDSEKKKSEDADPSNPKLDTSEIKENIQGDQTKQNKDGNENGKDGTHIDKEPETKKKKDSEGTPIVKGESIMPPSPEKAKGDDVGSDSINGTSIENTAMLPKEGSASSETMPASVKNGTDGDNSNSRVGDKELAEGSTAAGNLNNSLESLTEVSLGEDIIEGDSKNTSARNQSVKNGEAAKSNVAEDENQDFSKAFGDLNPKDVPENYLPILSWNYEAIMHSETSEQIFGLGNKLDHVAAYKPLCLDIENQNAFMFEGQTKCSGFNRTTGWLIQYCTRMQESVRKEYLLEVQRERKARVWLTEHASEIRWVEGLTVLQVLEKNCGNIAHYAGRMLMLQHILENVMAYAGPPSQVMNVLIVPTFHIMKRFLYPGNYEFWHKNLLQALIAPSTYTIGTLGNFLYRSSKPRDGKAALVQLLHNFSTNGSGEENKKYVCFRRAIVPGFLKARFFVNDIEYPSTKPSLQSSKEGAPIVPRDSLRMRERVSALFDQTPAFAKKEKEIMLLDRTGSRRVFGNETRDKVLAMMAKVAKEKDYKFTVTNFQNMKFTEQYQVMKKVSIAVGIHGANLVNTMFMPPLSVLLEIFPYGFRHEMYVNGGNAGLKYMSHMMKEGAPFEGPNHYKTVDQCIKLNQQCKVHYRDATLEVSDGDMADMERLLKQAIDWCDALPSSSGGSGGGDSTKGKNQTRRRSKTRRRKRRAKY